MDAGLAMRVMRVRLHEQGHSFEEIDNMHLQDFSDIIGYWSGKSRAEEKLQKKASAGSRSRRKARSRGR